MAKVRGLILPSAAVAFAALCSPIVACSTPSAPAPAPAISAEAASPPGPTSASKTTSPPGPTAASKVASPPASTSASKTASPPASNGASKTASAPTSTGTSKAASPPASTSASKTASPPASTGASKTTSPAASDGTSVTIYLIALDAQPSWQRAKGVSGAEIIGCNDYLVPVQVKVGGDTPEARAEAALTKLLSLTAKDLAAFGYESGFAPSVLKVTVERKAGGKLVIDLKGKLSAAGTCSVPRMKAQIERTAAQFGQFTILVNGSEAAWRCFGDESGNCK